MALALALKKLFWTRQVFAQSCFDCLLTIYHVQSKSSFFVYFRSRSKICDVKAFLLPTSHFDDFFCDKSGGLAISYRVS